MKIDYYLALSSPWSFMGHAAFGAMAKDAGAEVTIKPVNALDIFNSTGGLPLPKRSPERQAYRFQELERWRQRLNLPLNLRPAHFPADETEAACLVVAARETGQDAFGLAGSFMSAVWTQDRNIADEATIRAILANHGMDYEALTREAVRVDAAGQRDRAGEEAIAAGVFGVPTYHFGGEMFWGQDRLSFVEEKLKGGA